MLVIVADVTTCGDILYCTIPPALAIGKVVFRKFECTASGEATGINPPEAALTKFLIAALLGT